MAGNFLEKKTSVLVIKNLRTYQMPNVSTAVLGAYLHPTPQQGIYWVNMLLASLSFVITIDREKSIASATIGLIKGQSNGAVKSQVYNVVQWSLYNDTIAQVPLVAN